MIRPGRHGQTLVEAALVMPLLLVLLFGIILLGLGVFYQQQLANAAREAARYAAIHSATARCPTVPHLDPASPPLSYTRCDRPTEGWPNMSEAGRRAVFGLDRSDVMFAACWAGYRIDDGNDPPTGAIDAPPPGSYEIVPSAPPVVIVSEFVPCEIAGVDPLVDPGAIACTSSLAAVSIDQASAMSEAAGRPIANRVTAFACYEWHPPMGGMSIPVPCAPEGWCAIEVIPSTVRLSAAASEPIQRQQ